ncbi:hypothetical protein [Mesobacillus jeotgali]|uniref:hypothetical protein n=1 Tax=Mesobacillus jeotgali TaxID=129985 RepID=UPI00177EA86B|nr:hypothetical protein [Mesobacillus jeotgali]UYZ22023.1 hypothetical protein FOF60_24085 [Mesobacillus jeotgali]
MRSISEIPPFIFDTDCISSFIWARRLDVLYSIFGDNIYIPRQVKEELDKLKAFSNYSWVPETLSTEIANNKIKILDIMVGTDESNEFLKLTSTDNDPRPLGKGEAAAMSLARFKEGTVLSNNLNDVKTYCHNNNIGLISTDDILCLAHFRELILLDEGERIWLEMKNRKRKLPSYNFEESYRRFINDLEK